MATRVIRPKDVEALRLGYIDALNKQCRMVPNDAYRVGHQLAETILNTVYTEKRYFGGNQGGWDLPPRKVQAG